MSTEDNKDHNKDHNKEDNKKLSRRFLEELWNRKNLSVIDELLADTYVDHTPPPSDEGPQGPEALKQVFEALRHYTSDIHASIEDQIAEEDRVTTRVTWEFTPKSDDPSAAPQAIVMGVGIDRIDRGKIVESWNALDILYRVLNLLTPVVRRLTSRYCDKGHPCPPGWVCNLQSHTCVHA